MRQDLEFLGLPQPPRRASGLSPVGSSRFIPRIALVLPRDAQEASLAGAFAFACPPRRLRHRCLGKTLGAGDLRFYLEDRSFLRRRFPSSFGRFRLVFHKFLRHSWFFRFTGGGGIPPRCCLRRFVPSFAGGLCPARKLFPRFTSGLLLSPRDEDEVPRSRSRRFPFPRLVAAPYFLDPLAARVAWQWRSLVIQGALVTRVLPLAEAIGFFGDSSIRRFTYRRSFPEWGRVQGPRPSSFFRSSRPF